MLPIKTIIFSYQQLSNVGCEIIIRGTIAFLTRAFPDYELRFVLASYDPDRDRGILGDLTNLEVIPMVGWKRFIRGLIVKLKMDKYLWTPRFSSKYFRNADLFLSVGGDIYTMSGNKLPRDWLGYEKYASSRGIPSVMFGANMEKFEVLSSLEITNLISHLNKFSLITVRDQKTLEYLAGYNVKNNTIFFPDPIFMLRPSSIFKSNKIKKIGLNISPIILRDYGEQIIKHFSILIHDLVKAGYNCTLLPHVYASDSNPSLDDRFVLRLIHNHLDATIKDQVKLHEGRVSFESISKAISELDFFIGARMHACLNAVTLGKPTYFLSYSRKAYTMVDWMVNGPYLPVADRIGVGPADQISMENIVSLINAHENSKQTGEVVIDMNETILKSSVWKNIARKEIFKTYLY